jgi:large subunit ribosomal protein L20
MPRVKSGMTNRHRHKKVLKRAAGFTSANSRCYTHAIEKLDKAMRYAYRDRKVKKRTFRQLWTQRINAAARLNGTTYSVLIGALNKKGLQLDRKSLSELAVTDAAAFATIVQQALA